MSAHEFLNAVQEGHPATMMEITAALIATGDIAPSKPHKIVRRQVAFWRKPGDWLAYSNATKESWERGNQQDQDAAAELTIPLYED